MRTALLASVERKVEAAPAPCGVPAREADDSGPRHARDAVTLDDPADRRLLREDRLELLDGRGHLHPRHLGRVREPHPHLQHLLRDVVWPLGLLVCHLLHVLVLAPVVDELLRVHCAPAGQEDQHDHPERIRIRGLVELPRAHVVGVDEADRLPADDGREVERGGVDVGHHRDAHVPEPHVPARVEQNVGRLHIAVENARLVVARVPRMEVLERFRHAHSHPHAVDPAQRRRELPLPPRDQPYPRAAARAAREHAVLEAPALHQRRDQAHAALTVAPAVRREADQRKHVLVPARAQRLDQLEQLHLSLRAEVHLLDRHLRLVPDARQRLRLEDLARPAVPDLQPDVEAVGCVRQLIVEENVDRIPGFVAWGQLVRLVQRYRRHAQRRHAQRNGGSG
mmetsp:Transcript_3516/g.8217  ORF Transcript_3516/g.8217 Transcript_3516/m.8217 type:complete len:396 (+) Transcript_3516:850-2037(+)